jgi:hypothetical protein
MSSKTTQISTCPNPVGDVVRNNTFSKALAAGMFALTFMAGTAAEAGPSSCPVFTAAMVDAAAMVVPLADDVAIVTPTPVDDPSAPRIECRITSRSGSSFVVFVQDFSERALVFGSKFSDTLGATITELEASVDEGLTKAELHACRAQVLQSFVWNQYCAPAMP